MLQTRQLMAAGIVVFSATAWSTLPGEASTKAAAPAPPVRKAPEIFQINPVKLNPHQQTNVMILGQNLGPTATVKVGDRPTTTVEADTYHLLVRLPADIGAGAYIIEVSNEAGTARSDAPLVVDTSDPGLDQKTMVLGGGFVALLALVMRLARSPIPAL